MRIIFPFLDDSPYYQEYSNTGILSVLAGAHFGETLFGKQMVNLYQKILEISVLQGLHPNEIRPADTSFIKDVCCISVSSVTVIGNKIEVQVQGNG